MRNLHPTSSPSEVKVEKGQLVFLPAADKRGNPTGDDQSKTNTLVFQYNPEQITRTRSGEWQKKREERGNEVVNTGDDQTTTLLDGHRGGGLYAESETINFKLVFDATELRLHTPDDELGILPELSWLEQAALGAEKSAKKSKERKKQRPSEMLLILGKQRVYPVVMTSLNITEQRFDANLVPVRAECDVKFRILEAGEVKGNKIAAHVFVELVRKRNETARTGGTPQGEIANSLISQALGSS